MYKRKGNSRVKATPTIWSALPTLESVRRLNRRCVMLIAKAALERADDDSAVFARKDIWARIDARSAERAARCPVLLLNLQLHQVESWQRAIEGGPGPLLLNAPAPVFSEQDVIPLLRTILTEAWGVARVNVFASAVLFGMTPVSAQRIAKLSALTIDQIAINFATAVRPRWEDCRSFWSGLLEDAVADGNEPLTRVHLHALQLLGSEVSPRHVERSP